VEIDKSKIGKIFAVGGENIIRKYQGGYLLKSPIGIRIRLGRKNFVKEQEEDFPKLKKYFSKFLPEVHLILNKDKSSFDILQKFVEGDLLTKSHLNNPAIKTQLNTLFAINCQMEEKENLSWDFFGAKSLFLGNKDVVGNLVVTKDNSLKFIDIGTMRIKKGNQPLLVWLIIWWAVKRQRKCLEYLLNSKQSCNK